MLRLIDHHAMGKSENGWLHSTFHFSFAEYYNPQNIHYGPLRVVNDDTFAPGGGFDIHFHENMEIISYVINGTLTHRDNMGNERTVTRGNLQYMSAGTGILHSEFNHTNDTLRFLQIWITPAQKNLTPNYGDYDFPWDKRCGRWLLIISGVNGSAPVQIHQDVQIFVAALETGASLDYELAANRQAYLVQIEGQGTINNQQLFEKDAAEINGESLHLTAKTPAHYILFDLPCD